MAKDSDMDSNSHEQPLASLENTIDQVKDEAKEVTAANVTVDGMKDEGITDNLLVLVGLVSPLGKLRPVIQQIASCERPPVTSGVLAVILLTIYMEWIGYVLAASLIMAVGVMVLARQRKIGKIQSEVIIDTSSDKSTMESIVEAQQSLKKHTETMIWMLTGCAVALAVVPFKFILIGLTAGGFMVNARIARASSNPHGNRRWREWWESIPAIPVRTVDKSDL
ncbi:hypothetical protein PR202_ga10329 [Eleusine coracana subsp. coracana]|uniref:Uncharacterized protein n=1 Tax=Eleusine coracana subsp. coracana TaxID=191504 RepID=A0AAV5C6F7_ELECO|nr:hypothetical protein PR202_ga10329 [Eleusine coracana subsp. coracana]